MQTILCVRRSTLEERLGGIPLGLTTGAHLMERFREAVRDLGEWRPRPALEEDPAFLQVVVQGLVTRGTDVVCLFRTVRGQKPGEFVETRHNAKVALSAGGHVEPVEAGAADVLHAALLRELDEELVFRPHPNPTEIVPLGLLCKAAPDALLFDRVHIGMVYHVPVPGSVVLPSGSTEFTHIEFAGVARLRELFPRMEGWGQLLTAAMLERSLVVGKARSFSESARENKLDRHEV